jgi:Na+-exporting ATPase
LQVNPFILLLRHLVNGLTIILLIAAVLSIVTEQWIETGVILFVVVANTLIGFLQEFKSEQTMASLKKLSAPVAKVLRDGELAEIPAPEIVPGDIITFEQGDIVSADLRIIDASNLRIDEAMLTGESEPVEKQYAALTVEECPLGDKKNLAFMSCIVTQGRGKGVVFGTGMNTQIGSIAKQVSAKKFRNKTALQKRLDKMAYILFGVAIVLAIVVFAVNRFDLSTEVILYAIALGIAIIPEGLVAVVTLSMALGVKEMARQKALVRRLNALEALGAVTNICTDKTGTLTKAKMIVKQVWLPDARTFDVQEGFKARLPIDENTQRILETCVLCNTAHLSSAKSFDLKRNDPVIKRNRLKNSHHGRVVERDERDITSEPERDMKAVGDPTEIALLMLALDNTVTKQGIELHSNLDLVEEHLFDSTLKRMSVVYEKEGSDYVVYLKGAAEVVLNCCRHVQAGNERIVITDEIKIKVDGAVHELSSNGLRVIALAFAPSVPSANVPRSELEKSPEMTFLGLLGIYDPPREESKESVETCHKAGIEVHMATGDHPKTATAIAKAVSIISDVEGDLTMAASDFDQMTEEDIDALANMPKVIARCSPTSKVTLVKALHRRKRIVAMTGDGVNDASDRSSIPKLLDKILIYTL